jgi:hypothetical protein
MNANEVLIDILEDTRRRLYRFVMGVNDECFFWQPDPGANSIAVTIWHMGRLSDVFLTQQAKGEDSKNECWIANGWAKKTGYDPRGIGRDGWRSVNGYTAEEVKAIPRFSMELLIEYIEDVYNAVKIFLEQTSEKKLFEYGTGFEGRYTKYQIIQMAMLDNARHLGEIFAIKAMYDRVGNP